MINLPDSLTPEQFTAAMPSFLRYQLSVDGGYTDPIDRILEWEINGQSIVGSFLDERSSGDRIFGFELALQGDALQRSYYPISGVDFDEANFDEDRVMDDEELMGNEVLFQIREADIAAREQRLRAAEGANFGESLVTAGKILPRQKDAVAALHASLGETQDIQFGEGDAKVSPRQLLEELFKDAPKVIEFNELASARDAAEEKAGLLDVAESYIQEQKQKGKTVSASQAMAYAKKKMGV